MFNKELKDQIETLKKQIAVINNKLYEQEVRNQRIDSGRGMFTFSREFISLSIYDNKYLVLKADNVDMSKDDITKLIKLLQKIHKELK